MPLEIERKFLVAEPPARWQGDSLAESAAEIRQGYLTRPGDEPEVRLRKEREVTIESAGEPVPNSFIAPAGVHTRFWMAIKGSAPDPSGGGALTRREIELPLSDETFYDAWPLTAGRQLRKIRISYGMRVDGQVMAVVVDSFRGALEGLVLAEIEFGDLDAAQGFVPPPFLGREVSGDPWYRNAALAGATAIPDSE